MAPTNQSGADGSARRSPRGRLKQALAAIALGASALVLVAAALAAWEARTPSGQVRLRAVAGAVVARSLEAALSVYDPYGELTAPVCNCSSRWQYRCSDPEAPYFERVRAHPRLHPLFALPPHALESYAQFQDVLRDQFPHGRPTAKPWLGRERYNLLEMLADADAGSPFLCGDISKMFVQLVHAAGGFARIVSLSDPEGSGHVVTEAWVEPYQKWVVFDPDYNVYFTGRDGVPLSAAELHEIHRTHHYADATAHRGTSIHSVYTPRHHRSLLRHYHAIAFNRRANWVGLPFPPWHPRRHPIHTLSAWEQATDAFPAIAVRDVISDPSEVYFTPCRMHASADQHLASSSGTSMPMTFAAALPGIGHLGRE